ncbi:MAG: hypothetical protein IKN51_03850, partial [Bacteroidaceae bacterium]|nr:hypothetical protein [Bacteroidaceae bacterium]
NKLQEDKIYTTTKDWRLVPSGMYLMCNFCREFTRDNELLCFKIANDSIVWGKVNEGHLGLTYLSIHKSSIPDYFKYDRKFKRHCELFRDSLCADSADFSEKFIEEFNDAHLLYYAEKLKAIAPYGFFINWGWDYKYSLSFNFEYYNTNKKTIKYIEVFWVIKNDVGDTRNSGSFKGTGPLESFSSASWKWDYSNYRIAGDATNMDITKVILTYMDGFTKVVGKNSVIVEYGN